MAATVADAVMVAEVVMVAKLRRRARGVSWLDDVRRQAQFGGALRPVPRRSG